MRCKTHQIEQKLDMGLLVNCSGKLSLLSIVLYSNVYGLIFKPGVVPGFFIGRVESDCSWLAQWMRSYILMWSIELLVPILHQRIRISNSNERP